MTSGGSSAWLSQDNKACLPSENCLAPVAVICRVEPWVPGTGWSLACSSPYPCPSPQCPRPCNATALNTSTTIPHHDNNKTQNSQDWSDFKYYLLWFLWAHIHLLQCTFDGVGPISHCQVDSLVGNEWMNQWMISRQRLVHMNLLTSFSILWSITHCRDSRLFHVIANNLQVGLTSSSERAIPLQ